MSLVHFNTMVKNEEDLLQALLPVWIDYPVDKFVFYDDNSTDASVEVIKSLLPPERVEIISNNGKEFNESRNRSEMLEFSRNQKADYVLTIDCDELLSANFLKNFNQILSIYNETNLHLFWYNVADDTIKKTRQDPSYRDNSRSFVLPMKFTNKFDLSHWKYHTPRTPTVRLPYSKTKTIGVIHLQALNRKFYACKQMWYKHYEFVNYQHPVELINARYDPVVNNLDFQTVETPTEILGNITFDEKVFDKILAKKGYEEFINQHYNKDLVTFGQEYFQSPK